MKEGGLVNVKGKKSLHGGKRSTKRGINGDRIGAQPSRVRGLRRRGDFQQRDLKTARSKASAFCFDLSRKQLDLQKESPSQ